MPEERAALKMKDTRLTQPTLPGDFSPFNPWRDPPPRQRKVTVVVRMTAEEERMARRREYDMRQYRQEQK